MPNTSLDLKSAVHLLLEKIPPAQKKEAALYARTAYQKGERLPEDSFMSEMLRIQDSATIDVMSHLFETYLPHYDERIKSQRDTEYLFVKTLDPAYRQELKEALFAYLSLFLTTKGLPLSSGACSVVLLTMLRYSGLYAQIHFDEAMTAFEKKQGALLFEDILDYQSPETGSDPVLFMTHFLRVGMVFVGADQTGALLRLMAEQRDSRESFDLETLWLNCHEALSMLYRAPLGKSVSMLLKLHKQPAICYTLY